MIEPVATSPPFQDAFYDGLFREVYLSHLPRPAADAARVFGKFLLTAVLESPLVDFDNGQRFAAIADDISACLVQLREYSDDHEVEGLEDPVADWTQRLEAIVAEIRALVPAPVHEKRRSGGLTIQPGRL